MNPRALIARVAAMDRDELRVRAVGHARTAAGRLRFHLARPAWRRSDLAGLLTPSAGTLVAAARDAAARGDDLAAHRALASHFATRPPRWPVAARRRGEIVEAIRRRFPAAAVEARNRADSIVAGRFELLGYRDLPLGNPPDWHADVVNRRRAPRGYWASVPFLDPASGDHKVIWEANRHQHFLLLGAAWWLTGLPRFRDTFVAHLEDWLRQNPPLDGVNWASMLELAFRALSWTWAIEFFSGGAEEQATPWLVDLLVALERQLTHIERNLSTYFSPNTHLSGEALALYAVSRALPELASSARRGERARRILVREATAQILPDGGHAERSSHYHRYSTDFYLLALEVASLTGDAEALAPFERASRAQAACLRTIADDAGRLPRLGDDDGGQLFRFSCRTSSDAAPTLAAAASLLDEPSLMVGAPPVEAYWIVGGAPRVTSPDGGAWPSRVLPDSGYVVLRRPGRGHLIFDAGPHGFLNGGHAHADALSVVLTVAGVPLLVDPGTATYTMDPALRDRLRGAAMHNTVTIDGRSFAEPRGPFHWQSIADARMPVARLDRGSDFAVGMHAGYGFPIVRAICSLGDGWLIVDYAAPPRPVRADAWWHLHPSWSARAVDGGFALTHASGVRLALATTAADCGVETQPYSADYGRVEPATVLRTSAHGVAPLVMGAFVPASPLAGAAPRIALAGVSEAVTGWTLSFLITAGRDTHVRLALPEALEAAPRIADWPQPCIQEARAVCVE